jgi:hypothetical protein
LKWGRLRLRKLAFRPVDAGEPREVTVAVDGKTLSATCSMDGGSVIVVLASDVVLDAGQRLEVRMRFPAR